MHLMAAVVPPADALEEVRAAVRSVQPPRQAASESPGWRRKSRNRARGQESAQVADPAQELFAPSQDPYVLVAQFGHLSISDVERLETRLRSEAATWPAPLLRVEGVDVDASVEAGGLSMHVSGDTSALRDVVSGVQTVAARSQLFVDRRVFRPLVNLGSLTDAASEEYAAALLAALEGFVGSWWWQTHLSLMAPGQTGRDGRRSLAELQLKPRSGPL